VEVFVRPSGLHFYEKQSVRNRTSHQLPAVEWSTISA
jgi:hypothetical protein